MMINLQKTKDIQHVCLFQFHNVLEQFSNKSNNYLLKYLQIIHFLYINAKLYLKILFLGDHILAIQGINICKLVLKWKEKGIQKVVKTDFTLRLKNSPIKRRK